MQRATQHVPQRRADAEVRVWAAVVRAMEVAHGGKPGPAGQAVRHAVVDRVRDVVRQQVAERHGRQRVQRQHHERRRENRRKVQQVRPPARGPVVEAWARRVGPVVPRVPPDQRPPAQEVQRAVYAIRGKTQTHFFFLPPPFLYHVM